MSGEVANPSGDAADDLDDADDMDGLDDKDLLDVDEATLAELVDLSSGGAYSYEEAASDGPDAVSAAENGFMNAELVPTVAFG